MPKGTKSPKSTKGKKSPKDKKPPPKPVYVPENPSVICLIVDSIMDEILDETMNEIARIHLNNESIKFLVNCTHEAYLKFISINYYFHHSERMKWQPDQPIPPSPPDSWATNQIPIRPKPLPTKTETEKDNNNIIIAESITNLQHTTSPNHSDVNIIKTKLPKIILSTTANNKKVDKKTSTSDIETLPPIIG